MRDEKLRWSASKSAELKLKRGVAFEEIVLADLIAVRTHPTRPNQWIFLFRLDDYIWAVPFVPDDDGIFLKTLYRSRKYTKLWRRGGLP